MSAAARRRPARVLVVDEDPGGRRLLVEALAAAPLRKQVSVACDEVEALAFLRRQGAHLQSLRPDLILMPLVPQTPGEDGLLAQIKSDPDLRLIPVLVLSPSPTQIQVAQAYDSRASCVVVRPPDAEALYSLVRDIEAFWLETVLLPE